jgi:hypothetical protein
MSLFPDQPAEVEVEAEAEAEEELPVLNVTRF